MTLHESSTTPQTALYGYLTKGLFGVKNPVNFTRVDNIARFRLFHTNSLYLNMKNQLYPKNYE